MAPGRGLRQDRPGRARLPAPKGKQVYVEGSIRYDEWTDKDGNKRNTTKIRVERPQLAARRCWAARGEGGGGGGQAAAAAARGARSDSGPTARPPDDFQVSRRRRARSRGAAGSRHDARARHRGHHGRLPPRHRALPAALPLRAGRGHALGARLARGGDGAEAPRGSCPVYATAGVERAGQRRPHRGSLPPAATSRPRTTATARSPARAGVDLARRALAAAEPRARRDRT